MFFYFHPCHLFHLWFLIKHRTFVLDSSDSSEVQVIITEKNKGHASYSTLNDVPCTLYFVLNIICVFDTPKSL